MKYLIRGLCLLCLAVMLTACAGSEADETVETEKKNIVVGFSQVGSESSWRVANSESMKQALSEANGYELIFDDAKNKQENQYKAIRKFILQGVDYIILAPITEDGWDDVLLEAKNAGIPVIIVDRQVNSSDKLYTSWIGSDFLEEGKYAAGWLEEELKKTGRLDDDIKILHLMGTVGGTAQIGRSNGLYSVARSHNNWSIDELQGEYTEAKSYELALEYFNSGQRPDVIYCENDNMAFGVMRAMDKLEIEYGPDSGVIIISFDAVQSALDQCLLGNINLCVECNPLHGPRVDKIIQSIETGEDVEKKSYVEETAFSYDNITQDIIKARSY